MSIEIIPTGAALGAEIRGVDLARLIDEETFASDNEADMGALGRLLRSDAHATTAAAAHTKTSRRLITR